jgi:hypothetical protein
LAGFELAVLLLSSLTGDRGVWGYLNFKVSYLNFVALQTDRMNYVGLTGIMNVTVVNEKVEREQSAGFAVDATFAPSQHDHQDKYSNIIDRIGCILR